MIIRNNGGIEVRERMTFMASSMLIILSLILLALPPSAKALPDEAYGIVTNIVDGNTFDIAIEKADPRIISGIERIYLADVNSPDMSVSEGLLARDFTSAVTLNKRVYLDIDDLSVRDPYGRLVCVVYLTGIYGQPIMTPCINRMLVDSGYAQVDNSTNNEFDPSKWWQERTVKNVLLPEPGDVLGGLERIAGDMLHQPPEKQIGGTDGLGKQAESWLRNLMTG